MCGADPAALTCFLQCQVSLARFNGLSQFRLELFLQMIPCQEKNERLEAQKARAQNLERKQAKEVHDEDKTTKKKTKHKKKSKK